MPETPFDHWLAAATQGRAAVLVTLLEGPASLQPGRKRFVGEAGQPFGTLGTEALDALATQVAQEKLAELYPKSETRIVQTPEGEVSLFFDVTIPASQLVLFGAGHDAIPLAQLGSQVGFRVTVVDSRPAYATSERFPTAQVLLARPEALSDRVQLDPRSYAVIMNHHLERDRESLRFALTSPAAYVGVLGPRKRCQRMLDALQQAGFTPSAQQREKMHSPVGLDIGAESPEEVAVSIVAEVLAVRSGHQGGFLREREGAIHNRAGAFA